MKVWKTRQRIFKSNHSTIVTGLHAAFHFFPVSQHVRDVKCDTPKKKQKNRKANSSPGNWEKSDGWGTLPCCSLQLQSFYCLRLSSFGLVTMSQFVSITCTLALETAQLCFTITEHWHQRGQTLASQKYTYYLFMFWIIPPSHCPLTDLNVHFVAFFFFKDVN